MHPGFNKCRHTDLAYFLAPKRPHKQKQQRYIALGVIIPPKIRFTQRAMPTDHNNTVYCACYAKQTDGVLKMLDFKVLKCRALGIGMEAPGNISNEGSGVGSGSTTVVVSHQHSPGHRADAGVLGNMVDGTGVAGVVGNVFNKDSICNVDANPTPCRDLCCESYICCPYFCAGGHA